MANVGEFLFGSKGKAKKLSKLSTEQDELMKLIKQGLESGEGPLKDLFGQFDPAAFEAGVSKPALKQFQDEILPQLQEKFIAGNQVLGGGFQRAQMKAGTDLQSRLAELMYQAQNQQKQSRLSGLNTALGKEATENIYKPGTQGAVQGFVQGVGEGAGKAATAWAMG